MMSDVSEQTNNLLDYYYSVPYESLFIFEEFRKDIMFNIFFQNINYLHNYSSVVKFNKDYWIYKPEIFCADYYSDHFFWPVILLVNDLGSIFNFHPNNLKEQYIIAPSKESINTVIKNKIDNI